jgi:serine phosphatase RsbU (regulator of sigma subunit)
MIQALYADVLAFAGGAPQADDLTAVVLRRVDSA